MHVLRVEADAILPPACSQRVVRRQQNCDHLNRDDFRSRQPLQPSPIVGLQQHAEARTDRPSSSALKTSSTDHAPIRRIRRKTLMNLRSLLEVMLVRRLHRGGRGSGFYAGYSNRHWFGCHVQRLARVDAVVIRACHLAVVGWGPSLLEYRAPSRVCTRFQFVERVRRKEATFQHSVLVDTTSAKLTELRFGRS